MRVLAVLAAMAAAVALCSCNDSSDDDDVFGPYEFNSEVFPSRYIYIGQSEGYSQDVFPVEIVDTVNWDASSLERMPAPVTSAGVEDAPFITPSGNRLYFTFIGDVDSTPAEQLSDPTVGIYETQYSGGSWSEPEKIGLVRDGVEALCGGGSIKNDGTFWFNIMSESTGWKVHTYVAFSYYGHLTIGYDPGAPINLPGISAGEPDISSDGNVLYINSSELGGEGGDDLFVFTWSGAGWLGPFTLGTTVNTAANQNRPFITPDNQHLYFDSTEGATGTGISIFRSDHTGSEWGAPVEIVRNNVGEPSLTADGQWLYFTHFFFDAGMNRLEADIFRVQRK